MDLDFWKYCNFMGSNARQFSLNQTLPVVVLLSVLRPVVTCLREKPYPDLLAATVKVVLEGIWAKA